MSTVIMPVPKQQYFFAAGIPLVGGKVYTYAAGTNTPKDTYTDSAGTIPQANPIILNARGEPTVAIYWSGSYKVEVHDALDNLIYTVDNYNTDPLGVSSIAASLNAFIASLAASAGSSLIGFIQSGVGAILRTVQDRLRDTVSVFDFMTDAQRADVRNGVASIDVTAALVAAYESISSTGGTVWWPSGKYKVSGPVPVYSKTLTKFSSSAYLAPVPIASFTPMIMPAHGAWGYAILVNKNWDANILTDTEITYDGVRCIPDAAWNGHVISTRFASNVRIKRGYALNCADYCSNMACRHVDVYRNFTDGMTNCAYDFWEGCNDIAVNKNWAINNVSSGINFNAADTYLADRNSNNLSAEGNNIYGGGGAGIFVSPLSAGSTITNVNIRGNFIDQNNAVGGVGNNPDGIVVQRTRNAVVKNNTLNRIGAGRRPVIVTADAFPGVSDTCTVEVNQVTNSILGAQAMFGVFGTNHLVQSNSSWNSSALGGGAGVQVDDPSTTVGINNLSNVTNDVLNAHAAGGVTTPAAQMSYDKTNQRWFIRQPLLVAGGLRESVDYAVTATGANLATAYAITNPYTYFSTVALGTGAKLPLTSVSVGEEMLVWNQGANSLTLYANTGDTIGGAASIAIASGAKTRIVCVTATLWIIA